MTFKETKDAASEEKAAVETKAVEKPLPPSRVKSDPKLWEEAIIFSEMLTHCRPHGSKIERKFIAKYLVPIGVKFDKKGNVYKQIGENPIVLWSSHTDTVHTKSQYHKVQWWPHQKTGDVFFEAAQNPKPSCLGADDTTGVWLMLEMIKAKVPGLYIFHRGEEVGRIGSKWIADNNKDALKGIRFAIAFDRRGEKSIITYQTGTRCCSDEFADSLSAQLGMEHKCDTTGSYTDTASYVDLVAECTNVSTGYDNAHYPTEHTNVDYLFRLRDALVKIDVTKLVEKRKPGENTRLYAAYSYEGLGDNGEFGGYYNGWWDKHQKWAKDKDAKADSGSKTGGYTYQELTRKHQGHNWQDKYNWDQAICKWVPKRSRADLTTTTDSNVEKIGVSYNGMVRMIRENPALIADLLELDLGMNPYKLREHLIQMAKLGQHVHL